MFTDFMYEVSDISLNSNEYSMSYEWALERVSEVAFYVEFA